MSKSKIGATLFLRGAKKPRYFYGWNIVGSAFLAHIAYAEHNSSLLGLFFNPFKNEFGWSRTNIGGVQSVARITEGLLAPLIGSLVDRYGPRMLMLFGGIVTGVAFLLVTQVHQLWQFYLLRGVITAMGFAFMGSLVTNTAVAIWFKRRRGRAMAIASMGTNLSTLVMAPVTVWVISVWGWRSSFFIAAALTWAVVIIPAFVLMRRRPEDLGLYPDGDPPAGRNIDGAESTSDPPVSREPLWTRKEVLRTVPFWLLVASYAMANLAFQGINISVAPYTQDLGYGAALVAGILSIRSFVMFGVAPVWGLLSEHSDRPLIRSAPFVIQAVSCVFFILSTKLGFLWLAVVIYAVGFAGATLMQEVVWANYFGRVSLGTVRSTAIPVLVGFSAAGPVFMSGIFDITGSYRPAFIIFLVFFLFSSFLMWVCRAPTPRRWAS